MECINFDEQFEQYEHDWIHEHAAEYGNSVDRMEEEMPALYEEWLHLPAEWLGAMTTHFCSATGCWIISGRTCRCRIC